jgi:hypothetical protein
MEWSGRDNIAEKFRHLADQSNVQISPLYAALGPKIAEDEALLRLSAHAQESQPPVNLLLASVQYMLLYEIPDEALAQFYHGLTPSPGDPHGVFPAFKAYCSQHEPRLRELISAGVTNTNETGRCAVLLPAFHLISEEVERAPLHMIEIGCSAGLNLTWDRFHYDYGQGRTIGSSTSPVQIKCDVRDGAPLPNLSELPDIASRQGLELNPVDLNDEHFRRWLRALIWPEQTDRAERLDAAINLTLEHPPQIHSGDAVKTLPAVFEGLPEGEPVCVYHSLVFYQITESARQVVYTCLDRLALSRPVFRVAYEMGEGSETVLDLITHGKTKQMKRLALCHPHGAWLEWLA